MKSCKNCYWYDKCDHTGRCEYYDPIYGAEQIIRKEYEVALYERVSEYDDIVKEMNS